MDLARKLKEADDETKDLVSGYVRRMQNLFKDKIIPKEVTNLCIIYYFITEFFAKYGDDMNVSTKDTKNDLVSITPNSRWNTAYGNIVIDINETPNLIYRWTIAKNTNATLIGIEIDDFRNINSNISAFHRGDDYPYYYWFVDHFLQRNDASENLEQRYRNKKAPKNAEITMELNCKDRTIRFIVNKEDFGIAFTKIIPGYNYRFGVSLCQNGDVQLVNFEIETA